MLIPCLISKNIIEKENASYLLRDILESNKTAKILDVGFSDKYSLLGNFIEKNYPYPQNITALSVDSRKDL